jgi:hypothetical protein
MALWAELVMEGYQPTGRSAVLADEAGVQLNIQLDGEGGDRQ